MSLSYTRSPGWLRGVQIGLGILVIALSIFALTFPAYMFLSVIVILSIILFFVGIEKIITGMILHSKSRWTTVGLGILVLIFAGLAISFLVATAFIVIIFIGIALLFSGIARYWRECWVTTHYGQAHFLSVWELAIIISIAVLVSPAFGAALGGVLIAIGLLITGIQMVASGIAGQRLRNPVSDIGR